MARPADVLFGKIALKNRLVDEAKIKECLGLLASGSGGGEGLGRLLVAKGYLTPAQCRAIDEHVVELSQDGKAASGATESAATGSAAPAHSARAGREVVGRDDVTDLVRTSELAARDYARLSGKPLDAYLYPLLPKYSASLLAASRRFSSELA